jgi:DNA-binding transcriptional regulator YhcF (GntR family)
MVQETIYGTDVDVAIAEQLADIGFTVVLPSWLSEPMGSLPFIIDREAKASLSSQIYTGLRDAIRQGTLAQGARLPSWRDLATQLEVSRGTVRVVYERLLDEQLLVSRGAGGTRIADTPIAPHTSQEHSTSHPLSQLVPGLQQSSFDVPDGRDLAGRLSVQALDPHDASERPDGGDAQECGDLAASMGCKKGPRMSEKTVPSAT